LVTSPFELSIDKKAATESGLPFISINMGLENFIKTKIDPKSPPLLSRAFLKLWELIINFDLIPSTNNFVSAHLAEGPGSFIQATILYRDLLEKEKKIKSSKTDKYYAVTLHSDNEHLLMQKEFINYYSNEKPKRLNILETVSRKDMKDMYGGAKSGNSKEFNKNLTDGDITRLHTINLFGGSKNEKNGFAEPADFITADGGFDWKNENLQEQEAYKLIFSEILTALKCQKNGGNFVLKIFETYTLNTIKLIELLRTFYDEVIISKPFTSRISNSEKYLVCKGYVSKKFTAQIAKKLEDMLNLMNKNSQFNIIEIFSDFKLDKDLFDIYKNINIQLTLQQYVGINNIIKFINLDNYNGIEYNEYLDKQIEASNFWVNTFLEPELYDTIHKFINSYTYMKSDNFVKTQLSRNVLSKTKVYDVETNELKKAFDINNFKAKTKNKKTTRMQKGGGGDSEIENPPSEQNNSYNSSDSYMSENESDNEYKQELNNVLGSQEESDSINLNELGNSVNKEDGIIDLNTISEYEVEEIKKSKTVKFSKGKSKSKINII
jgi:23S rRNA U2552 (ribose-2'-O)-methylase RlmE/FtsJ